MRKITPVIGLLAAAALLSGCGSAPAESTDSAAETQPGATQETPAEKSSPKGGFSADRVTSCDQVEELVAPYIEGLVAQPANMVDEWGTTCGWETKEGELNPENIRMVQVVIVPVEAGTELPDTSFIANVDGGEVIEDPWVEQNGGVAYSLTLGTAVAGAISTVVWLPGVEVTVAGGSWSNIPALDGQAAVKLAQDLLTQ